MADNKRKTQEILELELQVKEQDATRSLRNVIKTSEELTKTSILGNRETKKVVDSLIRSVKKIGDEYGKNSNRYRDALKSTQSAMDDTLNGEKTALKLQYKRLQKNESEIKRTRDLVIAADAIGDALRQQVKIKSDLISDDQEREDFLQKELEKIEDTVVLRKKEAVALRGNLKALKEMTKETAAIRANSSDIASSTKGVRFANQAGRAVSAGGRGILKTVDTLKGGYSRDAVEGLVKGLRGANNKFGGAMKDAGKALSSTNSPILQAAGKLTSIFGKLSAAVSTATRFLGWFASAVMVAIEADERQKEVNKALSRNLGSAGMKSGDMQKIGNAIVNMATRESSLGSGTLRLTSDQIIESTNALMSGGVSLKTLSNGFDGLQSIIDTTAVASRNFGIEMSEAGSMVAEYFQAFGAGSETIKDVFATLNKDIKMSGMTTTQFLSTIQSVSAQFNIFMDQTKDFSGALRKMSQGGALTTKQLNKMTSALANFGPKTVDEGIKAMALYGPELKKQAAIEQDIIQKRLAAGNYGTEAERYQDQRRLESLQVVKKGGLNAGAAVQDALGSFGMIGAVLEKEGIKTFKDMRTARNDAEKIKLLAAKTGMSDNDVRDFLEATSTMMESTNQNFAELLQNSRKELQQRVGAEQARREAEEIASNTITKLSGMSDIGNSILYKIADLMQKAYNVLVEIGKKLVNTVNPANWFKDEGPLIAQEELKKEIAQMNPEAKGASDYLSGAVTEKQYSNLTKNMAQITGSTLTSKRAKVTAKNKTITPVATANAGAQTPVASPMAGGAPTLPKVTATDNQPSAQNTSSPTINMSAVLQLPNNQPLELIVKKVIYEQGKKL